MAASEAAAARAVEESPTSWCGSTKTVEPRRERATSTPRLLIEEGGTGTTQRPSRCCTWASGSDSCCLNEPSAISCCICCVTAFSATLTAARRLRRIGKASDERPRPPGISTKGRGVPPSLVARRSGGAAAAASVASPGQRTRANSPSDHFASKLSASTALDTSASV